MISVNKLLRKSSMSLITAVFVGLYGLFFIGFDRLGFAADAVPTENTEKNAQSAEAKPATTGGTQGSRQSNMLRMSQS